MDQSNTKDKLGKKSGHCDNSVLNGLLEKKLCEKTENRPQNTTEPKKEIKALVKVDEIANMDAFAHKKIGSSHLLIARLKKIASGLNWLWPEYHMRD